MAKGPPYHRLKLVGIPTVDGYRRRVVDESNKEIKRTKGKYKYCGYEAFYEFKRCPECGKVQEQIKSF